MTGTTGRMHRSLVVLVTSLLVCAMVGPAVASAATAPAADRTQVEQSLTVEPATVTAGDATSVAVTLSSVPEGLSGYEITVSVGSESTATIRNVTYADAFGITDTTREDDATAGLKAADVPDSIGPGDEDVRLATLEVVGHQPGETGFDVTIERIDDEDGDDVSVSVDAGSVTVREDGGSVGTDTPGQPRDATDRPTSTPVGTDSSPDAGGSAQSGGEQPTADQSDARAAGDARATTAAGAADSPGRNTFPAVPGGPIGLVAVAVVLVGLGVLVGRQL